MNGNKTAIIISLSGLVLTIIVQIAGIAYLSGKLSAEVTNNKAEIYEVKRNMVTQREYDRDHPATMREKNRNE